MSSPTNDKKRIRCTHCRRELILMPGDLSTICKDSVKCSERAKLLHDSSPGQPPTTTTTKAATQDDLFPLGPTSLLEVGRPENSNNNNNDNDPSSEGNSDKIARAQRILAVRALNLTHRVMNKIENVLENGVEVILKDGSSIRQEVQPVALAGLMRELRPVIHEPVRAAEAKDLSERPLINIDLGNADVIRAAVSALRDRRERQLAASDRTISISSQVQSPATQIEE